MRSSMNRHLRTVITASCTLSCALLYSSEKPLTASRAYLQEHAINEPAVTIKAIESSRKDGRTELAELRKRINADTSLEELAAIKNILKTFTTAEYKNSTQRKARQSLAYIKQITKAKAPETLSTIEAQESALTEQEIQIKQEFEAKLAAIYAQRSDLEGKRFATEEAKNLLLSMVPVPSHTESEVPAPQASPSFLAWLTSWFTRK